MVPNDSILAIIAALHYTREMRRRGLLFRLRSALAARLGISSDQASNGGWWELDLLLVLLVGIFVLGGFAWAKL